MRQPIDLDAARMTHLIESWSEPEPFSGVVHISRGDDTLYEKAQGHAIRSESIPNRVDTRFQMASGCKIFTSVAVCRLVETGAIGFDTPLSECVGVDFPNFSPDIRLRHLLTHTSGITSYFEEDVSPDYEALWRDLPVYRVLGPRDFLPLFQHKPMKFKPGERFDYNDGGFIVLGLVVEAVSGKGFAEYVRREVLDVAGMADSGYFRTDQLPERTAYAYIDNEDGTWRTNFFAVPMVGAPDGGAYSTAPDMAKFWRALENGSLLEAGTLESMMKDPVATSWKPPYTHYGYGVWIDRQQNEVRKHFVEGSDPGVAMRSAVYGSERVTLTVMGNTGRALWPLLREMEKVLKL
jgi:CubicO group peptidase (beta-lactamase class C family)